MKSLLGLLVLFISACQSMNLPQLGISEKAWLRQTLIADLSSMDENERVWKSGDALYHFREGKLVRVSPVVRVHEVREQAASR